MAVVKIDFCELLQIGIFRMHNVPESYFRLSRPHWNDSSRRHPTTTEERLSADLRRRAESGGHHDDPRRYRNRDHVSCSAILSLGYYGQVLSMAPTHIQIQIQIQIQSPSPIQPGRHSGLSMHLFSANCDYGRWTWSCTVRMRKECIYKIGMGTGWPQIWTLTPKGLLRLSDVIF